MRVFWIIILPSDNGVVRIASARRLNSIKGTQAMNVDVITVLFVLLDIIGAGDAIRSKTFWLLVPCGMLVQALYTQMGFFASTTPS